MLFYLPKRVQETRRFQLAQTSGQLSERTELHVSVFDNAKRSGHCDIRSVQNQNRKCQRIVSPIRVRVVIILFAAHRSIVGIFLSIFIIIIVQPIPDDVLMYCVYNVHYFVLYIKR